MSCIWMECQLEVNQMNHQQGSMDFLIIAVYAKC